MAEMLRNAESRTEYWRPSLERLQRNAVAEQIEGCRRCSSEFVIGARFCHVCGLERDAAGPAGMGRLASTLSRYSNFVRSHLGLTTASLVAFIMGVACLVATLLIGAAFDARTVLDWQALQVWRIQWLLAAVVAFVAGILLNRTSVSR